jgi:hypothetical protein
LSYWTLFSNHGHVLVCLSRDPEARLRDVAADVGITERAVQKIVRDLQDAGMLSVTKSGRRNRYRINHRQTLRHELEDKCTLKDLLNVVNKAQQLDAGTGKDVVKRRVDPAPEVSRRRPGLTRSTEPAVDAREGVSKTAGEKFPVGASKTPTSAGNEKGASNRDEANTSRREKRDKPKIATKTDTQQGSLF